MKQIWSGSLSFSLVTIPVQLFTAVKEHVFGFKLLCAKCKTPIQYQRFCPHCDKNVAWNDVVKGFKLPNGDYFIITPENLKALKPEKMEQIKIKEFVALGTIDIIYFEHHYYVTPGKKAESSYNLFCKALLDTQKAAIATFVMRDKEYVCALTPYHGGLLLTTLNYQYEIVPLKEVFIAIKARPSATELKLAKQLITQNTVKEFDISLFKDTFAEKLKRAIKLSKGKKTIIKPKKSPKNKEENLINSLKASMRKSRVIDREAVYATKHRKTSNKIRAKKR